MAFECPDSAYGWRDLKLDCMELSKITDDGERNKLQRRIDAGMWTLLQIDNKEIISDEGKSREKIDQIRSTMAGNGSFEEFCKKVREFDDAPTCGLVWTPSFVAYRCRTCGLTPAMSMCSECFLAGNHDGHDYNMFRSQAGGACDCGDPGVMQESGFCPKHAAARSVKKTPPEDLLCIAEQVLPHIYRRLLIHFRFNPNQGAFLEASNFISFLQNLSDLGAAMKNVMSVAMISKEVYARLQKAPQLGLSRFQDEEMGVFMDHAGVLYQETLNSMESIATQDDADALGCPELCAPIQHQSFVDEFMFWLVKFEFPQRLVTLLLSLLSNSDFRVSFAEAFVQHYTRTANLLSKQRANETVANRVIHMSVQLMSSERLSLRLNKDHKLLRVLVVSLHNVIRKGLTECTLHTTVRNEHRVVDLSSPILENHNYWALASDLHNVLGNKALPRAFLRDLALVELWCNFISFFQGMNVNTRQLEQHLEYESRAYYPAFTAEIEICSAVLWSLVNVLKDEALYDCVLHAVKYVLDQIQEWFENINFMPDSCWKPPPLQVTFHLPLHRLYAAFVCQTIKTGMQVMCPSETLLRQLIMHPLQIQVVRSEVSAGMWVRNGQSMRYQSCLYVQTHFCSSFLDLDLYLLQVCGTRVHPDWFVLTTFDRFHLVEWLSFAPAYPVKRFLRPDWEMQMLEGALRLIATMICKTTHLGMSDEDIMRFEVATLLAMSNKTHSQILDQLPDTGATPGQSHKLVEKILPELATYQPPQFEPGGTMRQGTYVPKDVVWQKYFDPLFVMARSMQMKEYQDAFIRYTDYVRKSGLYKNKGSPWPPLVLPCHAMSAYDGLRRILHCRSLHAILYVILYKSIANLSPISEQALWLTIYLLELAVQLPAPGAAVTEAASKRHTVLNLQFCGWFPGNCIFTNLCHRVDRVLHIDNMPGLSRSCQNGSDTDAEFPDLIRLRAKLSGSTLATSPDTQLVPSQVPRSRSGDIPFIDSIEADLDVDTDYFYNKAMSYLPVALRRQYLANSPERLAITMDDETASFVEEVTDELALVAASTDDHVHHESESCHDDEFNMDTQTTPQQNTSQLAIECAPNDERSLVLKRPGTIARVAGAGDHSVDDQQNMLEDGGEMHSLPPSAPPPHALPQPKLHVTNMGESILSLLIKSHNKLVGDGQPYRPPAEGEHRIPPTPCAGDGPFYITNLLDRVYALSPSCRQDIDSVCGPSTSSKTAACSGDTSSSARKQAAKDRQQRLMAQFTSKQKAVMDQLMQQEEALSNLAADIGSGEVEEGVDEQVECVICNQESSVSMERPIGLVASAMATSVFGKAYPEGEPFVHSIFDVTPNHKKISRGQQETDYYRRLVTSFNKLSCISSTSMGWEGGVCVSTCGHYVHFDCHDAYMKAVKADTTRPQAGSILAVDKGEFYCPLCRQLANCVLPLLLPSMYTANALKSEIPNRSANAHNGDKEHDPVREIMKYLHPMEKNPLEGGTMMSRACRSFIYRLLESTYPRFSEFVSEMNAIWAFLCGILRTNFEAQFVWDSTEGMRKRSCLRALLNLMPSQISVEHEDVQQCCLEWAFLTGMEFVFRGTEDCWTLASLDSNVPMALKDTVAMLIRMSMVIMQKAPSVDHFAVLCQAIYNLTIFQSIVNALERFPINQIPASMMEKVKDKTLDLEAVISDGSIELLASYIFKTCYGYRLLEFEADESSPAMDFYAMINISCKPFLQVAAMIKYYGILHRGNATTAEPVEDGGFDALCAYVLNSEDGVRKLRWYGPRTAAVLGSWIDEIRTLKSATISWEPVLARRLLWSTPRLIPLPKQFDLLFQKYHKAQCLKCRTAPKETLLCLICGDIVCYRDTCCMSNSLSEVETHAVDCGAGAGVYLSVQTSTVLITRDKRAGHWGSLYLDAHGEEDRGLKRGKPLTLSEERFAMLERHWVSHAFDSVCKRWFWLGQSWPNIVIPL